MVDFLNGFEASPDALGDNESMLIHTSSFVCHLDKLTV